jgi:hypothetical protein
MKKKFDLIKPYLKIALYVLIGLVVMYGMIYIFTPKPQMPTDYKNAIDSLKADNVALRNKQKQADSAISSYQKQISNLDNAISNIKVKETIIKEYYHEVSGKVGKYTPTQVDSFFKARYNY